MLSKCAMRLRIREDCRVGVRAPEATATMPSAGKRAALAG